MYIIPEDIKRELRRVIGKLIEREEDLLNELRSKRFVTAVGDMITYTLLKKGFEPDIAIVDFRHKRKELPEEMKKVIERFGDERIEVKNPPSIISDDLIKAIDWAYKSAKDKKIIVVVEGEEDLSSLIAILLAPRGATVIYGLPDKGVVILDVSDKEKDIVRKTLERCKEHGAGDN